MIAIRAREEYCIGCRLCEVACMARQAGGGDLVRALCPGKPRPQPGTLVEWEGHRAMSISCHHCEQAPCVQACLTGAMQRTPQGRVVVDRERCVGCWTCILVCPYGAVRRGRDRRVAAKCDFCPDRERPACVEACPNRALVLEEG